MASSQRSRTWPLVVLGTLGVVAYTIQSEIVARIAARALETAAGTATGEDVRVTRVDVSYFPPEVELEGLQITHPATGERVVSVDRVRLEPGLDGLRPVLGRLEIDRPDVSLHLDPDGLREFRDAAKATGTTADTFPWRELVVRDGRLRLEAAGATLLLDGITATPTTGTPEGRTDLSITSILVRAGDLEQRARFVQVPGVTVAPDRVVVPDLELVFDGARVAGQLAAARVGPLNGALDIHGDLVRLTRTQAPAPSNGYVDGTVDVSVALGGTVDAPTLDGGLAWKDIVLWKGDPLQDVRLGEAEARWSLDVRGPSPVLAIDDLDMRWAEGRIAADVKLDLSAKTAIADVRADSVRLPRILQAIGAGRTPWVDLVADVRTQVQGTYAPLSISGDFVVDVERFAVNDGPIDDARTDRVLTVDSGTVAGELFFDADRLVLDAGSVIAHSRGGHHSRGRARADIGFTSHGPLSVDVDMRVDLAQLAPLGGADLGGIADVEGWIGGRYDDGLTAEATIDGVEVVALGLPIADTLTTKLTCPDMRTLQFDDIAARRGESDYRGALELAFLDELTLDAQVYVPDGRIPDLAGVVIDLPGIEGRVSGSASLQGTAYRLDGDVDLSLADVSLYGERFPEGQARAYFDDGLFTLDALQLRRGDETLYMRGSIGRAWKLAMQAEWDGAHLESLDAMKGIGLPLSGVLVVDAQFDGTLYEPAPRGRIATRRTAWNGAPLPDARLMFRTDAGVLTWSGRMGTDAVSSAFRTDGTLDLWKDRAYDIHASLAAFPVDAFYPRGADGSPVDGAVTGAAHVTGAFGGDAGPAVAPSVDAQVDAVRLAWNGHTLTAPEPWRFTARGDDLDVPELNLVGDDGTALRFGGTADGDGGMRFTGGGTFDLGLLPAVVPDLERSEGKAKVELRVARDAQGSVDPRVRVTTRDATIRTAYFPGTFEGLRATVDGSRDGYVLSDVAANVGGGTLRAGPSRVDANGWIPSRYALAATLDDVQVKYLDYLPPMTGDADLRFDGPVGDLLLGGTIDLSRMEFRERIDWEAMVLSLRAERLTDSAPEERGDYFAMDIAVHADDTVALRNNVATADASADLRIVGDTQRPGMVGTIRVAPGGRMYVHERAFDIARGELRYVDPYTYDPDLDILLETTVRSAEQDYNVDYLVRGPFSDWRTDTSADPYLSQADINTLLLFGATREELERYGGLSTALVAETGDLLLAQTALTRLDLFVDRWSLVSGVSERGSSVLSTDLRLVAEKQVGGFDVTLEKNLSSGLGTDWYASVERRLAQRLFASGYVATRQEGRALPIGAAYGAEFKFRWEMD